MESGNANNLDKKPPEADEEIYGQELDMPKDDYRPPSPHKNKKPMPLWLLITIGVLFIVGIGAGAWFYLANNDDEPPEPDTTETTSEEEPAEPDPAADGSDVTTNFSLESTRTTNPRLEFSYPDTWTVDEDGDDVTITSPNFSFSTVNGDEVNDGHFKLYFRQGARDVDSAYIGRGVAALSSQQINYDDPATGQRDETFLQFFGLDATNNLSFMLIAGNFELSSGDTLGPDFGRDDDSYIIVGGYSSAELEDDLDMHQVAPDYFRSTNAYEQAEAIIKSLRIL